MEFKTINKHLPFVDILQPVVNELKRNVLGYLFEFLKLHSLIYSYEMCIR